MLSLKDVSISYGKKQIISDFSLDVNKGEVICIVGPNGIGKSTLSKAIANTIDFTGSIQFDDKEISSNKRKDIAKIVGFLSQSNSTYFPYTVYETVEVGRYIHHDDNKIHNNLKQAVNEALERVGLLDLADRRIDSLSGGQLQRVYLARLLVQNPHIVILDEPTNNLDFKYQLEILDFITKWVKEENKIALIVMHDLNLVQKYADRVVLLEQESKYSVGNVKEVLTTEKLKSVYGINVREWMLETLDLWR